MKKITTAYLIINRRIDSAEKILSVIIISAIVIIVFAGTIARYVFEEAIFGADRLATYLMVWLGFMGFQIAVSRLRHIEIEFVKTRMKPSVKYILNIISSLITSGVLFAFASLSYIYMEESRLLADEDIALGIPMWWVILIIPLSFSLSALRSIFISLLWLDVLNGKRKEEEFVKKQLL